MRACLNGEAERNGVPTTAGVAVQALVDGECISKPRRRVVQAHDRNSVVDLSSSASEENAAPADKQQPSEVAGTGVEEL